MDSIELDALREQASVGYGEARRIELGLTLVEWDAETATQRGLCCKVKKISMIPNGSPHFIHVSSLLRTFSCNATYVRSL